MADDEKAIEEVEGDRGDGKEVHGGNVFAVIVKKRKPTLRRFMVSGCTTHPAGDRALRYIEAEHEEFAVDARRTPGGIVNDHLKDLVTDLFGDSLPADFARFEISLIDDLRCIAVSKTDSTARGRNGSGRVDGSYIAQHRDCHQTIYRVATNRCS